ncbi:MAG: thiamine pyrophosphate-dependent enzyme, partial [Candidatus Paceibacterales bacterium]
NMKENRDPIDNLRKLLIEEKHITEDKLKELEKGIRDEMEAAVEFAKASPEPDAGELWTEITV